MSNVVEFPLSDRPIAETDIDALHAEAFRDLENRMMDCVSMAKIAAQIAMNTRTEDRELVFAVAHTWELLENLLDLSAPPAINFLPEKQRDHPGRQRSHVRRP
jgi:hypothetical protein